MKRFWTKAEAVAGAGGWGIELDGKPLRTPARAALIVPTEALGAAVADEWNGAQATFDPQAMTFTGLANAAIDRIAPDPAAFAAALAHYGTSDLTCYRAEGPDALVDRQSQAWDPLLAWGRRRFDMDFTTTCGIIPVDQPTATTRRLAHEVATLDPFRLAGLSPLVTIGGSLLAALAVLEGAVTPGSAWDSVTVDERWQLEQWGSDLEAEQRLANRKRDFLAAARFLELLEP
ncbi:MAG: ATP12 family protein [Sphingomicrobium sp.]